MLDKLRVEIVSVAKKYIGQKEISGNLGFNDKLFEDKMKKVGFQKGFAWCSLFAELVYKEAYNTISNSLLGKLEKLFSASVMTTRNNFVSQYGKLKLEGLPGDLVIWQNIKNPGTGHIAILSSPATKSLKYFNSIEGNTNGAGSREGDSVLEKQRLYTFEPTGSLKLLGFISPIEK